MDRYIFSMLISAFLLFYTNFSYCQIGKPDYREEYEYDGARITISEISKDIQFKKGKSEKWLHYSLEINVNNTIIKKEEMMDRTGIIKSGITDFDNDDNIEIYIYWKSEGTGSYANLAFFELNEYELVLHKLPELNSNIRKFYRGKDRLEITKTNIFHNFPAYNEDDANCCPSGGDIIVTYSFKNNEIVEIGYFLNAPIEKTEKKEPTAILIIKQINGLPKLDSFSETDCWLQVFIGNELVGNTDRIRDNNHPQFNAKFEINTNGNKPIRIKIFDKDLSKDELVGEVMLEKPISGTYPILYEAKDGSVKNRGEIVLDFTL